MSRDHDRLAGARSMRFRFHQSEAPSPWDERSFISKLVVTVRPGALRLRTLSIGRCDRAQGTPTPARWSDGLTEGLSHRCKHSHADACSTLNRAFGTLKLLFVAVVAGEKSVRILADVILNRVKHSSFLGARACL